MALRMVARMIGRGIKHTLDHKVSSALILLLVIALIFVSTAKTSEPSGAIASQPEPVVSAAPASTENYFKGQATFDSTLIWDSLSDDLISRAEMNGATQEDLQIQLDEARALGRNVESVSYIGNYEMEDGGSMQFYVATVRGSLDLPPDHIFYVFTLGSDGKIESIE